MSDDLSPLWDIPGQARAAAALRGAVERDEVSHAWAFLGRPGVGQEQAARALMAALNCPAGGCGICDVCMRCRRGAHPAYWEFAPTGAAHRVAEVREQWLPAAFHTATEGRRKVLRILDADRMNESAANAFLKGLEEPPPSTVWVLEIADPDELPDTILSRCRPVRFAVWGPDELDAEAQRLGLRDDQDRALAVRACLGSLASLRRLATPGHLDDLRMHRAVPRELRAQGPAYALVATRLLEDEIKRRTAQLKADGKAEIAELDELHGDAVPRRVARQVTDRHARREREARTAIAQAALDDLVGWYRDVLLVSAGGDPARAIHADDPDGLLADAESLPPTVVLSSVDRCLLTREHLELNVGQGLALESLFIGLSALAMGG